MIRFGWLAAAVVLATDDAWACRCTNDLPPDVAYQRASAVALARVAELAPVPTRRGSRATLAVSKAWKKALPSRLVVQTLDLCHYKWRRGEEHLVYLHLERGREYLTTRCMGNRRRRDAADALTWLRRNGNEVGVQTPH